MLDGVKVKLRDFITGYINHPGLKDDDNYFATRLINSMFAMQLVMFVEKEFGIKVESADLDINNFSSINAIAGLVERKLG